MEVMIAALLGLAFLHVFYRAVRLQWPESYFGANDLAAYAISISPLRYAAFRFGPPLVTCIFVYVTLDRLGHSAAVGAAAVGIGHALLRPGWALIQAARWPRSVFRHRVPIVLVHVAVLLGLIATTGIAIVLAPTAAPLVPPATELSATLWTALVAGVIGAFVVRVSRGHPVTEYELAAEGRRRIPRPLWELAGNVAREQGADVILTRAIMLVENLQRPSWFRRLERCKGRVLKRGTYGIMQTAAAAPLSDEESIRRVVVERLAGVDVRTEDRDWHDTEKLERFARTYNPNPNFVALLVAAYSEVESQKGGRTEGWEQPPGL